MGVESIEDMINQFTDAEIKDFFSKYQINEVLGSGGFGVVLSARDILRGNKSIALKVALCKEEKDEMLQNEYNILHDLQHPNIVKLYSIERYSNFLIMAMKLGKESLEQYANKRRMQGKPLSELEVSQIVKGVLEGLAYLDEKNIIHRDIKLQNILIGSYTDLSQCIIIDFGLATYNVEEIRYKYNRAGTLLYQSPEQLKGDNYYGKSIDIWATGVVLYELLTGQHPLFD